MPRTKGPAFYSAKDAAREPVMDAREMARKINVVIGDPDAEAYPCFRPSINYAKAKQQCGWFDHEIQ